METLGPKKIIGTFHKSGSAFWNSICRQADRENVFKYWHLREETRREDCEVFFYFHAHEIENKLADYNISITNRNKWLVCIRDPRDIIVSAAYYHMRSKEKWCHVPMRQFGGLTYQEKICSLKGRQDKFLFEMENYSSDTIESMVRLRRELAAGQALFVKLEELVGDVELAEFRRAFAFLGFDPGRIVDLLAIATERSFFSDSTALERNRHARSASSAEFLREFDDRTMARFEELFPGSVEQLDYPVDGLKPKATGDIVGRRDEHGRFWPSRRPRWDGTDSASAPLESYDEIARQRDVIMKENADLRRQRDDAEARLKKAKRDPIAHLLAALAEKWRRWWKKRVGR